MKRKKIILHNLLAFALALTLLAGLAACGNGQAEAASGEAGASQGQEAAKEAEQEPEATSPVTLRVGVCAGPYGDMFTQAIAPSLEEKGYRIKLVEFSDYVQPNNALASGEIEVNMFQHSIYLADFAGEHDLDLIYIKEIPTAGMGIFSDKWESLAELPQGASVAIPNDATNLSRAIRVLAQTGLVVIDPEVDPASATQHTLSENPKELTFVEVEAPQLPRSVDSVDIAVVNGNYALSAGLNLADALHNEVLEEGYINVIAVRTEDKDSRFAKDIVEVVESDAFRSVIEDPENQFASFHRPEDY